MITTSHAPVTTTVKHGHTTVTTVREHPASTVDWAAVRRALGERAWWVGTKTRRLGINPCADPALMPAPRPNWYSNPVSNPSGKF